MNKKRRNDLKYYRYKRRIRRFAACCNMYVNRKGKYIYNPKTVDILNDRGQLVYKTTSTPCSCSMCSGDKYQRHKKKAMDRKLIDEYFFNP